MNINSCQIGHMHSGKDIVVKLSKAKMKYICGSHFMPKRFKVGRLINYFIFLKHLTKEIASKSEKVPIFRYIYLQEQIIV